MAGKMLHCERLNSDSPFLCQLCYLCNLSEQVLQNHLVMSFEVNSGRSTYPLKFIDVLSVKLASNTMKTTCFARKLLSYTVATLQWSNKPNLAFSFPPFPNQPG